MRIAPLDGFAGPQGTVMPRAASAVWWRPARLTPTPAAEQPGGRVAFGALIAFTSILILSPQVWFPVFRSLRIALLAAGVAIVAHLLDSAVLRRAGARTHPEVVIAFCLAGWAALTVPLSYWPGGSVAVLTEHFLKAIAFFWLIGGVVTTPARLRTFLRLLVICSIPLALTAVRNYQSGVFVASSITDRRLRRLWSDRESERHGVDAQSHDPVCGGAARHRTGHRVASSRGGCPAGERRGRRRHLLARRLPHACRDRDRWPRDIGPTTAAHGAVCVPGTRRKFAAGPTGVCRATQHDYQYRVGPYRVGPEPME